MGEWLFGHGAVILASPVRLHEYGVDLAEFDGAGLVADGFEQAAQTEVSGGAQDAFGGLDDEVEGLVAEGAIVQTDGGELTGDEGMHVIGCELLGSFGQGGCLLEWIYWVGMSIMGLGL